MIRDAEDADASEVAELLAQLGYPCEEREAAERLAEWREQPLGRVLVAVEGERVVGVLALHAVPFFERAGRRGRVVSLVVDENARERGVGARLLRAAEDTALRLGCVDMELTSSRERAAAHAFYERMGYQDHCSAAARFLRPLPHY